MRKRKKPKFSDKRMWDFLSLIIQTFKELNLCFKVQLLATLAQMQR